jgi:pimeloyl-ACP methyl ester carboxylesterase
VSVLSKTLGVAGVVGGVAVATVLSGVTAQRAVLRRSRAMIADGDEGYDSLAADRVYSVVASDGAVLHVEEVGPIDAPLTVVFSHGWALRMGSWHFQRMGLDGPGFGQRTPSGRPMRKGPRVRMVFYDQRSHGKSTRGPSPHPTIEQLAADLEDVLSTAAPEGPVVLIGHSMGGMATLGLAGTRPELFASRVVGVGLVSTSATQSPNAEIGRIFLSRGNPVVKVVSFTAARYSRMLERTRASTRDAVWMATRMLGFARRDIPASLVDYLDEMLTATPIDVIADFVPGVLAHDQSSALPALVGIPVSVICGDADRITPPSQSAFIAAALPDAEFVLVDTAGHLAMMEAPEETNDALRQLIRRAAAFAEAQRSEVSSTA